MDDDIETAMQGLRSFMFSNVYQDSAAKSEEHKAKEVVRQLYTYYLEHTGELPEEYLNMVWIDHESLPRVVCDYVAGMTDDYAIHCFQEIYIPNSGS